MFKNILINISLILIIKFFNIYFYIKNRKYNVAKYTLTFWI